MQDRKINSKYHFLILSFLFLFALVIRLFYLSEIKTSPFFNNPVIDSQFHDEWARQIAAGDWSSSSQGVFYKAPLYPYFMAVIYKFFGHSYYNLILIQLIMGTMSCILIYALACEYFNKRAAYLAFFISALYGTFVYFEGEIEIAALHNFLNLLLLLALGKAQKEQNPLWWLFCGLILGISALSVPTILLFIPFILHLICWDEPRTERFFAAISRKSKNKIPPPRPFWKSAILLILGTLLAVSPATVHNYNHEKKFCLISANGGLNFFLGNNLHAGQTIAIRPGIIWSHFTSQPHVAAKRTVGNIEEDQYWADQSIKYIKNYPTHFIRGIIKKFALFWNSYEIKRNNDMYFQKRYSRLLRLPLFGFGFIAPLGLLGIVLCLPQRRKFYLPLFYLASVIFGVIVFFVADRYRVPAVPILIIFAAFAIDWLWENRRNFRNLAYFSSALIFLLFLINYDFWGLKSEKFPDSHHNLGFIYYKNNQFKEAIKEWELALNEYPDKELSSVDTHYYLSNLYNYKLIDYQKAIYHADKALEILPNIVELETELGWAHYKSGNKEKAVEILKNANLRDSLYEPAYVKLARIYAQEKKFDEAKKTYQTASNVLKKDFNAETKYYDTKNYAQLGLEAAGKQDWAQAEKFFKLALEGEPDSAPNEYNLGLVYLNTSRFETAARHLEKSTILNPKKAENFGALGSSYFMLKDYERARKAFKRALEIDPRLELAKKQLELCK